MINFHDLGQFTFSGLVSANGSGTGTGGTITVSQTSSLPLDLSNSEIQANAGATSGDGGNISITAFQMIVSSATFQAVGIGTGTGGEIDLNITDPNSVIDIAKATSIQATGGNNGFGGTVSVTDTAALPDPLAVIDVYPLETGVAIAATHTAASPRSGPTGTGGVIKVTRQGVTCQFYPSTTFPAWPKGYFNCAHAGGATLEDKAAINIASTIPASGRNTLSNSQIWVWGSFGDLNKFTKGKAQDVGESGNTTPNANNTTFYVNVFENVSTLPNPLTVTQLKETTAHEFGHVNDFVKSESGGASYNSWVQTDYAALDYDKILLTPQTSHRRAPCSTSPYDGRPGPFVGVIDQNSGLAFCNGTVFANSLYLDAANGNNPYRNSWVLQTSSPYFTGANPVGWLEVYAQTFAFSSYAVNLTNRNDYFVYTLDGVEKNGLFACVQIWSTALVNGSTTPPSQVGCPAVPTWYPPLLGHKDSHD